MPETSTHDAEADARNAELKIYLDGDIVPRDQAKVSVYDSGFLLGDGVWEGIRLHNARWAFLDAHLDRLFEAAKAIDLDIRLDRAGVTAALDATAAANAMTGNVHARLMITRGVKDKPFQDPRLSRSGPTMVIIMEHSSASEASFRRGIRLATVPI
ncbi:MAG: aminotransferase class IV, partial [Proteobacteria bacterium]|nr:aminotransferase class IV [Pseudomonadota bacterium]